MTKSLRQINNERKEIKDKNLNVPDEFKNIYKVVDKLEQRISKLEKVLESHAKCIGQLREENFIPIRKDQIENIEKELERWVN